MSPISCPSSFAFSTRRRILPLRVFGSLVDELDLLRHRQRRQPLAHEVHDARARGPRSRVKPGRSATNAFTTSMFTGSGLPIAADSATAACSSSALSISNGPDQVPAGVDHVVVAPAEPEVAVGVEAGLVAADVPAVQELAVVGRACCSSRSASCSATAAGSRSGPTRPASVIGSPVFGSTTVAVERRERPAHAARLDRHARAGS